MRRALVLAGGNFDPLVLDGISLDDTRIVCVDRGLEHAMAASLAPDLIIGDLDSVSPELLASPAFLDVPRLVFPADKDASDLELALVTLADDTRHVGPIDEVVVAGVSGGRTDHLLFNWLLPASRAWPFGLRLIDATVEASVVTPDRPLTLPTTPGQTVSLLPIGPAHGVTADGLHYALSDATLEPGATVGLSNRAVAAHVTVSIAGGVLLALATRAGNAGASP